MAKRRVPEQTSGAPQVSPDEGVELLKSQIESARRLLSLSPLVREDIRHWELLTSDYLEKAFGARHRIISNVMHAGLRASSGSETDREREERWRDQLKSQVRQLEGAIEILQTNIKLQQGKSAAVPAPELGSRVFLVHGHDEGALNEVARFLEKLRHNPIVLKEQPGKGRTIIEKFEDYASEVRFVAVLLTPDDRGGPADKTYEDQQLRARQNVILELGYFIGRLGRNYVCALRMPDVEIPSDYSGVQYVSLDGTGWRLELAREMKAAGLDVDMNLAVDDSP